jgi:hypothetical protein
VPGSFGAGKHVIAGANSRIAIEWAQSDGAELPTARETETGSADAAECPSYARRRFIDRQKVLTFEPMEFLGAYLCVRGECRSMKSPAHRAMAVTHIGKRAIHLVTNCAAKTTALYFHAAESSVDQRPRLAAGVCLVSCDGLSITVCCNRLSRRAVKDHAITEHELPDPREATRGKRDPLFFSGHVTIGSVSLFVRRLRQDSAEFPQSAAAKCASWSACAFTNAGRAVARAT